ncbi:MAG: YhgE/Pip family protein [Massiliimalia sp.]|jgi:putative membrane protein
MRNVWKIFCRDFQKIRYNVIAWIVVLGLSVVPSLYAWFNIAASWDPYGNTGTLKVAVANQDFGYEGNLIPIKINLGEMVLSNLRANEQLDWTFVSKEQAVEGVKSGEYYAAIVIPGDFSQNMMSLFSGNGEKSELVYYLNEKENAIAPKVTDKGAGAVRQQVDQIFVKTVAEIGVDLIQGFDRSADKEWVQNTAALWKNQALRASADLSAASNTLKAFSNLIGAVEQTLNVTSDFLGTAGENTQTHLDLFTQGSNNLGQMKQAVSASAQGMEQLILQSGTYYDNVKQQLDSTLSSLPNDSKAVAEGVFGLAEEVQVIIDHDQGILTGLEGLESTFPQMQPAIAPVKSQLQDMISRQQTLKDRLSQTAQMIQNAGSDFVTGRKELDDLLQKAKEDCADLKNGYDSHWKNSLEQLFQYVEQAGDSATGILQLLDNNTGDLKETSEQTRADLQTIKTTLDDSAKSLDQSAQEVQQIVTKLEEAENSGNLQILKDVVGNDSQVISAFLSSPVQMTMKELYPVENYGSAMAPFYSALSIWVGGIILAAMLKVSVSETLQKQLLNVKEWELYFGRYLTFIVIGFLQSSLIGLGDLYFLEIQCDHPFYFLLTGWVSSLVYVTIIYTLTVSFGDIGKAISVILLVMQVAGSGGTFPIEMAPKFFQTVYPLLPFTHTMAAMRECIAGFYGNTYWIEMLKLLIFLLPAFLLGLVLRKPVIRFQHWFEKQLEETKVM